MRPFIYACGESTDSALAALNGGGRVLAGGTDLIPLMKPGIVDADCLIDIRHSGIPQTITFGEDGVRIGALATLTSVAENPLLHLRHATLPQAAAVTATPQIRKRATVGGSLLQRPRCSYFRDPGSLCWLEGGDECFAIDGSNSKHAIFGGGPCYAVHPSDLAGALLACDARITLLGPAGERSLPLAELFAPPVPARRTETTIAPNELILYLTVPRRSSEWRSLYLKIPDLAAGSFAVVGLALAGRVRDNRIDDVRVVFTGVAPVPWRHTHCEERLLDIADSALARAAVRQAIAEQAFPLAENDYKIRLACKLLGDGLDRLLAREC
jgi:xanthine dehydrogenase YagS FAD-binding subunit